MKKILLTILALVLLTTNSISYTSNGVNVGEYRYRIMPLGDSITSGVNTSTDDLGYRRHLQDLFGINNVYLVGQYQNPSVHATYQVRGSGLSGNTTAQMLARLSGGELTNYFSTTTKNQIILLHAGTNDIGTAVPTDTIVNHIVSNGSGADGIVEVALAYNPNIQIYICKIIPTVGGDASGVAPFHAALETAVNLKRLTNPNVHLIDMHSAMANDPACSTLSNCYVDTQHPNNTGYDVIATTFYNCIINPNNQYCDGH
jgi:lysophospholipase L1-like esterase